MENNNDVYGKIFPIFDSGREKSDTKTRAEYDRLYAEAAEDPEAFWGNGTRCLTWDEANDRLRQLMTRGNRPDRQLSRREQTIGQHATA